MLNDSQRIFIIMGKIRFLLAVAVIIAHSSPIFGIKLIGGEVAVQTFFIISGFYMALILTEKYVGINSSFKLFITNRFLKIYPIYWSVLLLALLLSLLSFHHSGTSGSEKINALLSIVKDGFNGVVTFSWYCFASIFLFFQDWFIFFKVNQNGSLSFISNFHYAAHPFGYDVFLPQAWTIGLELTFYLMAPFLIRRNNAFIVGLLILSVLIRLFLYLHWNLYQDPWSYRFFPNELAYFLFGVLVYRFYKKVKNNRSVAVNTTMNWAFYLVLTITIIYQLIANNYIALLYPIVVGCAIPFIFLKDSKSKLDIKIGELSYPIYISHITIIIVIKKLHVPFIESIGTTGTVFTIIFSVLLNELLTKRIETFRQRRIAKVNIAM